MYKEEREKIAVKSATIWCRCHKCDGYVARTGEACDKRQMHTCTKFYDGYRTALLALGMADEETQTSMTRSEAMSYLVSTGRPITHINFKENEYVAMEDGHMVDEQGYRVSWNEFWEIRNGFGWLTGWKTYGKE